MSPLETTVLLVPYSPEFLVGIIFRALDIPFRLESEMLNELKGGL